MANELTTTQQQRLGEILKDIQHSQRRVGLEVLTIGQRLLEAKDILWHGDFEDWVEMNCRFSARTAENMMNVARRLLDKPEVISLLPPGILYQLAAPSTNEKVIDAVATLMRDGKSPDTGEVEKIIRENKPPRPPSARRTVEDITQEVTANVIEEVQATGAVSVNGDSLPVTPAHIQASIIEQTAELIRSDGEAIRRKIEQEQGLSDPLRGKCVVDHVDEGHGLVTFFCPALANELEPRMRITYIIYPADPFDTPLSIVGMAAGRGVQP